MFISVHQIIPLLGLYPKVIITYMGPISDSTGFPDQAESPEHSLFPALGGGFYGNRLLP